MEREDKENFITIVNQYKNIVDNWKMNRYD